MQTVLDEFDKRVAEIDRFFALLKALEDPALKLCFPTLTNRRSRRIDPEWPSILRAAAFLMIYNLVESAIRDAFNFLYDKIKSEKQSCETLREEFRQLWIEQAHRGIDSFSASQKTYKDKAQELVEDVVKKVTISMDGRRLPISGNLDGPAVIEVCKRHGMTYKIHKAAQNGWRLTTVKTQRNALAHGNVSFVECGRQFSTPELESIKNQAFKFVRSVLTNVRRFAERRKYAV